MNRMAELLAGVASIAKRRMKPVEPEEKSLGELVDQAVKNVKGLDEAVGIDRDVLLFGAKLSAVFDYQQRVSPSKLVDSVAVLKLFHGLVAGEQPKAVPESDIEEVDLQWFDVPDKDEGL